MPESEKQLQLPLNNGAASEAIGHLKKAIAEGKHWYIALLEAIGLWELAEETHNGRNYRYLIDGEAFNWLLLAERLCEAINGSLPEEELALDSFGGGSDPFSRCSCTVPSKLSWMFLAIFNCCFSSLVYQ